MKSMAQWLADRLLSVKSAPDPLPAIEASGDRLLYVIPKRYRVDRLALRKLINEQGLPAGEIVSLPDKTRAVRRFDARVESSLDHDDDLQLIPVSVFWGRRPSREDSLWRSFYSDQWAVPGFLGRVFTVLTQRKQVQAYFSPALSLQELKRSSEPGDDLSRKLRRILRTHFRRQREAVVGPDLSHRRALHFQVMNSPAVQAAMAEEGSKGQRRARKYLDEIASDYSYGVVRMFDHLLNWLWSKLYGGISLHGMERVHAIATDHELVYVPCHRSHIDYLLLSYVIYHQGLMPPHIAAGINLNMPVVGPLLRRGGAFFIRREFRANRLYRAVLETYLATMCQKGFPIEYFIEGGRSRSGRLLQPKAGMLAMTLSSIRRGQERPLAFVPVYIGYERIVESHSYIKEMYGANKESESVGGLFAARRYLQEDFGQVHVQFGTPLLERDIWHQAEYTGPGMPPVDSGEFKAGVAWLARAIMTAINGHAVVTPINLIATVLLATPKHAILEKQLPVYLAALQRLGRVTNEGAVVYEGGDDWQSDIAEAGQLGLFQRNAHARGAIVLLDQRGALSATYLRNNTLHCFILAAIVASVLVSQQRASERLLRTLCLRLYPFLREELFLAWEVAAIQAMVQDTLAAFVDMGMAECRDGRYQAADPASEGYHLLAMVASIAKGTMERYYITLHLLANREPAYYDAAKLEADCVQMAERLSLLHSFHAPDFFDKNLFRTYIQGLLANGYVERDGDGKLVPTRQVTVAERGFVYLLPPAVRLGTLQITQDQLS